MVSEFCARRLAPVLPGDVVQTLQRYMVELLAREEYPPYRGAGLNLTALAQTLSLDRVLLQSQKAQLSSVFDAIARAVAEGRLRTGLPARGSTRPGKVSRKYPHSQCRAQKFRRDPVDSQVGSHALWSSFPNPCFPIGTNRTVSAPL